MKREVKPDTSAETREVAARGRHRRQKSIVDVSKTRPGVYSIDVPMPQGIFEGGVYMIESEMIFLLDTSWSVKEQQTVYMPMWHACYLFCYLQKEQGDVRVQADISQVVVRW